MAIQAATTGQLEEAQRIAIEQTRYTAEFKAPMKSLVEHMRLQKGEKSITVPKVGQMTAIGLSDGVDLAGSEEIGMSTTSLTTSEVGLKVILTDKLVRQENEDVFRIVGRQMGEAMARKADKDLLGLFSGFSTELGATTRDLELGNLAVCVGYPEANKFPNPIAVVAHPWSIFQVMSSVTLGIAGGTAKGGAISNNSFPGDFSQERLKDFYKFSLNGIPIFQDGNITADGNNDGQGAVFSKEALVFVESVGFNTERERDASLRATELVVTSDYGVFELDDAYGAGMLFQADTPLTS